jgi:hypothetical protein
MNGGQILAISHTVHVSKVIKAPLKFVYNWCTDFREDDNKITGSKTKRIILQNTKQRVIYISTYKSRGKTLSGVNIVTLRPPNAWHLDFAGQEDDEIGEYKLTRIGPRKTRLTMTFKEKYKIANAPTKEEDTKSASQFWDKYVAALQKDYACGR